MGLLEGIRRGGQEKQLREELQSERWQNQHLAESMATLERQMVDDGWRRLTTQLDREFTRDGLDDLMRISRAMYLSHPLIQRAVNVRAYYTWAQGVHVTAEDDHVQALVVEPMMEDHGNKKEIFGHQARILTDVDQSVDGNVALALWTTAKGDVSIRTVPAEEVREVISDPDDRCAIWFYRRCWVEDRFDLKTGYSVPTPREVFYPDWRYALTATSKPKSIGGIEVQWDAPIIHQCTGGLKNMSFGIPETYAALDWARAYQKFLEDWHTIVASLARFAWRMTTKGSKIQRAKTRLGSTITPDEPVETNRAPGAGGVFVGGESDSMTPIAKSGATTSADDARPSRLMIAAAMDLPDTILSGDADQGNLATAKTLDRPTELAIRSRQSMWADLYRDIFAYAIEVKQKAGQLGGVEDLGVTVSFPEVIQHDTESMVNAIVAAATLSGSIDAGTIPGEQLSRMLLQALGVEDIDAVLEDLDDEAAHAQIDDLPPEAREALVEAVAQLTALVK